MDAAAELEKKPVSKHHIQPEYRDEQVDARLDSWILPVGLGSGLPP